MAKIRDQGKALFMERFKLIEGLITRLAARHQLTEDEGQEVYSLVMLKIVQDNYAVLRQFRAQSQWSTYLTVVIQRVLLDQRTKEWGRWRPCATARRLGHTAIELDRWINREGLGREEAVQMMLVGERDTSAGELRRLVEQIPKRVRHRVMVSDRCLARVAGPLSAECRVEVAERVGVTDRLAEVFRSALEDISTQDRFLLGLRFHGGWTVKRIAAEVGLSQRPLYRRFEGILRRLRWYLESHGLSWEEIRDVLVDGDVDLNVEALRGEEDSASVADESFGNRESRQIPQVRSRRWGAALGEATCPPQWAGRRRHGSTSGQPSAGFRLSNTP